MQDADKNGPKEKSFLGLKVLWVLRVPTQLNFSPWFRVLKHVSTAGTLEQNLLAHTLENRGGKVLNNAAAVVI